MSCPMLPRRLAAVACLACLLCLVPAASRAGEFSVDLGETTLLLPEIPGFDGNLFRNSGVRDVLRAGTPPVNRLLWGYLSDADSARIRSGPVMHLDAYILVQAENALAGRRFSTREFEDFKQKVMDQASGKTVHDIVPMDEIMRSISDSFSEQYKTDVNVHVKHSSEISFFDEDQFHISAFNIVTGGAGVSDDIKTFSRAITYNIVLARNKIIYIYAYTTYRAPEDARAAMDLAQRICRRVVRDNPSALAPEPPGQARPDAAPERHFGHEQAAETAWHAVQTALQYLLPAVVGGALGLLWRRKRSARRAARPDRDAGRSAGRDGTERNASDRDGTDRSDPDQDDPDKKAPDRDGPA
ncbi:MAG: hypothetical protein AB7D57_01505 [Desulfovibrionaceae bacterium]